MKNFIQGMYQKKHFARRLISVILAVIVMGFALSWLVLVNFGTDPCTSMNLAISGRLGMSLGNWQALLNCLLFIIVILWGREYIGFGTLANMFLVGYSIDFFSWVWSKVLPDGLFDSMQCASACCSRHWRCSWLRQACIWLRNWEPHRTMPFRF